MMRPRLGIAARLGVLAVSLLMLGTSSRADEIREGKVKSIDLAAKRLIVTEAGTGHEMTVVVGDHTDLRVAGQKIALGRIKPGVSITIRDTVLASSITVGNESIGTISSIGPNSLTLAEEGTGKPLQIGANNDTKVEPVPGGASRVQDLKPGSRVIVVRDGGSQASRIVVEHEPESMLQEFWENFRHNLFKPLLLFFYMGFLVPILRVKFEFPYVMYQALTIYLLIAIGWHGGEELAALQSGELASAVGFMLVGFVTNTFIGVLAYVLLSAITRMRRIDKATVAGYYGSDSAGTFVTCLGVLASASIVYQAYMPVMLAVMEIPGCLVALYLVSRLRHRGMDAQGNMPDEPGYRPSARSMPGEGGPGHGSEPEQIEEEMALERTEHESNHHAKAPAGGLLSPQLLHEVFLNPGLYLLFGGIVVGYISRLQGPEVTRADDSFFVTLFQGVLCLFLLEMGMTASRKLRDLRTAGIGFIIYGILAPNIFATIGISVAHAYSMLTGTPFALGTYVLFSVLCGAASYIAVPAVQRLAIPEASPTLPLAASLGLTFSYNVTIGIPVYIEIAKLVIRSFPIH